MSQDAYQTLREFVYMLTKHDEDRSVIPPKWFGRAIDDVAREVLEKADQLREEELP